MKSVEEFFEDYEISGDWGEDDLKDLKQFAKDYAAHVLDEASDNASLSIGAAMAYGTKGRSYQVNKKSILKLKEQL